MTTIEVAAVPPKVTADVPVRLVPVSTTFAVVELVVPWFGDTDVKVGGAPYVNADDVVPVAYGLVTATATAPAACAGVTAVIEVALATVKDTAATPPNVTAVAPEKLVPLIVTDAEPEVDTVDEETLGTVGGAT